MSTTLATMIAPLLAEYIYIGGGLLTAIIIIIIVVVLVRRR
jgi:hypothetical protein